VHPTPRVPRLKCLRAKNNRPPFKQAIAGGITHRRLPLAPGRRLGPYHILSPLGMGGMGEVSRARDTRLERTVALKILPSRFNSDAMRK
jgi:serine/threonine protein kinase